MLINSIRKKYGSKTVLNNCNLSISKGEIIGIIGANGSGKTTLLKILSGIIKSYSGEIPIELTNNCIGLLETPNFRPNMSGEENLKYFLGNENYKKELNYWKMTEYIKDMVKTYSLGMRQKLALILVFSSNREYLVLDEPTNYLDIESYKLFIDRIKYCKKNGQTVIISTHFFYRMEEYCNSIYMLNNGRLTTNLLSDTQTQCYEISFSNMEHAQKASKLILNQSFEVHENTLRVYIDKGCISDIIRTVSIYNIVGIVNKYELVELLYEKRDK